MPRRHIHQIGILGAAEEEVALMAKRNALVQDPPVFAELHRGIGDHILVLLGSGQINNLLGHDGAFGSLFNLAVG